jgi:hypothetical protein
MSRQLRALSRAVSVVALLLAGVTGCQQTTGTAPEEGPPKAAAKTTRPPHRFDEKDPEIQALKGLDYQSVDMSKVDVKTEVSALLLLNSLLLDVEQKANGRIGLLRDYIAANKLEKALATDDDPVADVEILAFEDGIRIAVAYVRTPAGAAIMEGRLPQVSDATLARNLPSYRKLAQKNWADVAYSRQQVENMAEFLADEGKFDDFVAWVKEKEKEDTERRKGLLERPADQRVAEADSREMVKGRSNLGTALYFQAGRKAPERNATLLDVWVDYHVSRYTWRKTRLR